MAAHRGGHPEKSMAFQFIDWMAGPSPVMTVNRNSLLFSTLFSPAESSG
jgi:hypothetical protein